MTVSGLAGSPESDGALPTRRQARALRDAAAAPDAPIVARPHAHSMAPAGTAPDAAAPAVPVPPVPVALVLPDLAVVVESATTELPAEASPVDQISLSRPDTAPPGTALPELSVPSPTVEPSALVPAVVPLSRRQARAQAAAAEAAAASADEEPGAPEEPVLVLEAAALQPAAVLPADLALPATAAIAVIVHPVTAAGPAAPTPHVPKPTSGQTRPSVWGARATGATRPTAPTRRSGRQKPVAKMVTLLAIPALFLTAALPAYAFSPQGGAGGISAQAAGDAQALTVASAAAAVTISTDGFTATSQAELDDIEAGLLVSANQQRAAEEARASAAEFAVYGIRAEGDDYPWPTAGTESQGGGLSPLGYYYRECVDFVAWRLNRDAGSTGSPWKWTWHSMTPGGGDGSSWAGGWAAKGWPTSKTPIVGAVATFSYNHVAYVQSVPGDGTVVLEEYNWMGSHAYHTRTVPIEDVPLYLYPPT